MTSAALAHVFQLYPVCLIDILVNFQGGYIETDELEGYNPAEDDAKLPPQEVKML